MLTVFLGNDLLADSVQNVPETVNSGYTAGIIIAFLILGYLVYSLLRPEKF